MERWSRARSGTIYDKDSCKPLETRERPGRILLYRFWMECGPADNLDFGLQASRTENTFLLFEATQYVVLCYSSPTDTHSQTRLWELPC